MKTEKIKFVRLFTCFLLITACALFIGCPTEHDHSTHVHHDSETLTLTGTNVAGAAGLFIAKVTFDSPKIGTDNMVMLMLSDAEGNMVSGATLTATTFMPAHNHGSEPAPQVEDMGMGMYHIMKINYSMAGTWEVTVNVAIGEKSDNFIFTFDVDG